MSLRRRDQGEEYDARAINESLHDLASSVRRGVRWTSREYQALYTEPMWLGGLPVRPLCLILGEVKAVNGPEVPIAGAGGLVQSVWDGVERGARITKLAGLTQGTEYRYTFLVASKGVV